jgi:hypothetical protein
MSSSHKIDVRLIIFFFLSRARFVMHNKLPHFAHFFNQDFHPDGCSHFPFSPPFNMTHQHMDHDLYRKEKEKKRKDTNNHAKLVSQCSMTSSKFLN